MSVLRIMRRKFLFLAVLLLAFVVPRTARASEGDVQYLMIITPTETVAVALADNPVITYANDQLVITTAEKQVEVAVAEIKGYNFTEEEPAAIKNVMADHKTTRGMVAFDHLKAGSTVTLYNAKGERVCSTAALADGTAVIDMHGLAKGVYVVRSDKLSFKIINN